MVRSNSQNKGGNKGQNFRGKSAPRGNPKNFAGDCLSLPENSVNFTSGRVSECVEYWRSLTSDPWVLEAITGYRLPFVSFPNPSWVPAPIIMPPDQCKIMDEEVKTLLEKEAIEVTSSAYLLHKVFLVEKKTSGFRPIINLKPLNAHLAVEHFKMERVTMVRDLLEERMCMVKLDLKDAYFSIPVSEEDRKYLQFHWNGVNYQYKCLCFGLATAPFVFTKVFKPLVNLFRSKGIRIIYYLDDSLLMCRSRENLLEQVHFTIRSIQSAGFTVNFEKSLLDPVTLIEFLGVSICSLSMTFGTSKDKSKTIADLAICLSQAELLSCRQLARFVGLVISQNLSIRTCHLHLRSLQQEMIVALRSQLPWDQLFKLSTDGREELKWWASNANQLPRAPILLSSADHTIESDASNMGWGARYNYLTTGGSWSQ